MPVTTDELTHFKTIRKSVSFPGKHRRVDQQKVSRLLFSLDGKQKLKEEPVRGPLTFRKRFSLDADQAERANGNGATQKLERGCADDPAEKVLDPRGSLPSILSKYSKNQKKQTDAVAHQPLTRTLKSRDWAKTKDNDTTPLPLPGTVPSEQSHVDATPVIDKTHVRYHLRQESDPYREAAHRSRKYLMELISGKISGYPATGRKWKSREDEDTAAGRVSYHSHPHLLQHQQQRHHLDAAAAENNGHPPRLRHQMSESRSLNSLRHDQVDTGLSHPKKPEEDPSKQTIIDQSKQIVNYQLKHFSDPLKQKTNDPSKDQSKPTIEDPLKLTGEDHVKPTLKGHFRHTTGDPLNLARPPSTSFDVTQRNVEVRRMDRRQVQNEGGKAVVLDLLKGRSRRSGSGRQCFGVAAAAPDRAQPRIPSRCDFYVFEDLKRGSSSREAVREDVQKYIRDNKLMPPDKENWINQWLRTVSPSVRDDDLDGDPAPPRP